VYYFFTGWETEPTMLLFFQRDVRTNKIKKALVNFCHTRQMCPKSENVCRQVMERFLSSSETWGIMQLSTSNLQHQPSQNPLLLQPYWYFSCSMPVSYYWAYPTSRKVCYVHPTNHRKLLFP